MCMCIIYIDIYIYIYISREREREGEGDEMVGAGSGCIRGLISMSGASLVFHHHCSCVYLYAQHLDAFAHVRCVRVRTCTYCFFFTSLLPFFVFVNLEFFFF